MAAHFPARPSQRLKAFGWDYLLIVGYAAVLFAVAMSLRKVMGKFVVPTTPVGRDVLSFVLLVLPVVAYFALSEGSTTGQTLGKRLARIQVVRLDAGQLRLSRSLLRSFLKFLPWQIAHTCMFQIPGWPMAVTVIPAWVEAGLAVSLSLAAIYAGGVVFAAGGQTVYDRLSGAAVVSSL